MRPTILILLLASALTALSTGVKLSWCPNPEPNIDRYNVYSKTNGAFELVGTTTNTTFSITNLATNVTFTLTVTAVNDLGLESDFADAIWLTLPRPDIGLQTLMATNSATNVITLRGRINHYDDVFGAYFELAGSTNMCGTHTKVFPSQIVYTNTEKLIITADIPIEHDFYTYRIVTTNATQMYTGEEVSFSTIPPQPVKMRLDFVLIETASVDATNGTETMVANVEMLWPTNGVAFYKTRLDWDVEYTHDVPMPLPLVLESAYETNNAIAAPAILPMPPGL
jgi:hypothetical protein